MKGLREKFRKNEGFTLVEMLIVVAIIAILIAVSIPLVSNALEKARQSTDAANERAAKAEISIAYLTEMTIGSDKFTLGTDYYYDATNGKLQATTSAPTGYGKCTTHKGGVIKVSMATSGDITISWCKPADGSAISGDLCSKTVAN